MSNPTDPTLCAKINAVLARGEDGPLRLATRDEFGWALHAVRVNGVVYRRLWVTVAKRAA